MDGRLEAPVSLSPVRMWCSRGVCATPAAPLHPSLGAGDGRTMISGVWSNAATMVEYSPLAVRDAGRVRGFGQTGRRAKPHFAGSEASQAHMPPLMGTAVLVGPTSVAMIVSEFPPVQPRLQDAQIPPVACLRGVPMIIGGLAIVRDRNC